jgi:hypothetical protein
LRAVLPVRRSDTGTKRNPPQAENWAFNEVVFLWERHLAAMIVAGSHSHKGDTSLPAGWRNAP